MHSLQVILQTKLVLEHPGTNVTLEGLDVTHTMDSGYMALQATFLRELPAANLALVSGVRMLRFADALSMRRVVVRADR